MTFKEYMERAFGEKSKHLRRGQHMYNLLNDVRPDLADQVRATKLDPFYFDTRIRRFVAFISHRWEWDK